MNLGWDAGQTEQHAHLNTTSGNTEITLKFSEFVRHFQINNEYVYKQQLRHNLHANVLCLEVDLHHLAAYDDALCDALKSSPSRLLSLFEDAVAALARQSQLIDHVPYFQVMLLSDHAAVPIRLLDVFSTNLDYLSI